MRRAAAGILLGVVVSGWAGGGAPPGEDYARLFGRRYRNALDFLKDRPEAAGRIRGLGLDPDFALAVVFPEMLRFSVLADLVQVGYVQTLYVQLGGRHGDVSIGRFQMKPAFAETLEADFNRRLSPAEQERIAGGRFDLADSAENRLARVRRLAGLDGQVTYLVIFVRVMDSLHPELSAAGAEEKLRLFATAYNAGYRQGLDRLRRLSTARLYRVRSSDADPAANYADIALDYYRRARGAAVKPSRSGNLFPPPFVFFNDGP